MALYLKEHLSFDRAGMVVESEGEGSKKCLYMKGIFIQGGVKNANERVYPVSEIETAVQTLNEQIATGHSVLGEVVQSGLDHLQSEFHTKHLRRNQDCIWHCF